MLSLFLAVFTFSMETEGEEDNVLDIRLDRHGRIGDVHMNGEPTTYSTIVLGDPIRPAKDPKQPLLIVDSNGTYLTAVCGPRLERMQHVKESRPWAYENTLLARSTSSQSLSEISEEVTATSKTTMNVRAPSVLTGHTKKGEHGGGGTCPKCHWCEDKDATRYCKGCKEAYYCTQLCATGHWRQGRHFTACKNSKQ